MLPAALPDPGVGGGPLVASLPHMPHPHPRVILEETMSEPHETLMVVKMDRDWHPDPVESKERELHFAALDSAYKLLGEYAVRVAMESIRTAVNANGGHMGSDAEVFAESAGSGRDDAARTYADLAPHNMTAAGYLYTAFDMMIDQVVDQVAANLGLIIKKGDR